MKVGIALPVAAALLAAQVYQGKEEKLPRQVEQQPVPFSHKTHSKAACGDCHTTYATNERAGLPQAERCMLCHRAVKADSPQIRKLVELARSGERIRWVRVYRVPEYVFFSHAKHLKAKLKCGTCHGQVAEKEVLAQEVPTSMTSCMNCHTARKVSNECGFCHLLGY
jgi:hypothetical protein